MPAYTSSALRTSPSKRTILNSVFTAPGEIAVTRMSVSTKSCNAAVVRASIACLVAQ